MTSKFQVEFFETVSSIGALINICHHHPLPEKLHFTNVNELENARHDWEETHRSTCEVICTFSSRTQNREKEAETLFGCLSGVSTDGGGSHQNAQVRPVGPLQSFLHAVCER